MNLNKGRSDDCECKEMSINGEKMLKINKKPAFSEFRQGKEISKIDEHEFKMLLPRKHQLKWQYVLQTGIFCR